MKAQPNRGQALRTDFPSGRVRIGHLLAFLLLVTFVLFRLAGSAHADMQSPGEREFECRPITAANRVQPPPPLWRQNGEAPPPPAPVLEEPTVTELCPLGQIAYPVAYQEEHPEMPPLPGSQGSVAAPRGAAEAADAVSPEAVSPTEGPAPEYECEPPPESGKERCFYHYAMTIWHDKSVGGSIHIQVGEPEVDSVLGTHSLGQLAYIGGGGLSQTVELGWTVAPTQFGSPEEPFTEESEKPRLFTYVNKDEYASNDEPGGDCYDCEFVPVEGAEIRPGQILREPGEILEPTSSPIEFAVEYQKGNWWVYVYDQWIGYLKGSFWNNEFTQAPYHEYYGEVYDEVEGFPSEMGNGLLGSSLGSLEMSDPYHFASANEPVTEAIGDEHWLSNEVSNSGQYSIGRIGSEGRSWHFGGPGGRWIRYLNAGSFECLSNGGGIEPKTRLGFEECSRFGHPNANQEWADAVHPNLEFFGQLINRKSELCVTNPSDPEEVHTIQEGCNVPASTGRQLYRQVSVSNGFENVFLLQNRITGECLEQAGETVRESACGFEGAATSQLWREFIPREEID